MLCWAPMHNFKVKRSSCESTLSGMERGAEMSMEVLDGWIGTSTALHPDHKIPKITANINWRCQSHDVGQTGLLLILPHSLSNHYCLCGFFFDLFFPKKLTLVDSKPAIIQKQISDVKGKISLLFFQQITLWDQFKIYCYFSITQGSQMKATL